MVLVLIASLTLEVINNTNVCRTSVNLEKFFSSMENVKLVKNTPGQMLMAFHVFLILVRKEKSYLKMAHADLVGLIQERKMKVNHVGLTHAMIDQSSLKTVLAVSARNIRELTNRICGNVLQTSVVT